MPSLGHSLERLLVFTSMPTEARLYGGGEENLTFNGTYCNVGGGLDIDTGIFTCPTGGTYLFMFHIATHDNKKALLSIRKNGEEIASIFDQNHKDNHKNSMAGQNIILDVKR